VSSYTPTLAALLHAQEGQCAFPSDQIKLLAIAAEYAHNSSGPRLQHVPQEDKNIFDVVQGAGGSARSDAGTMTTGEVVDMIKSANVIHFACHGKQYHSEPHKSHFYLNTGNLGVSELIKVDLRSPFLAFLSAYETAQGDPEHADEVVHLAATMLFVGFKSVVVTMWYVNATWIAIEY
jgi:CHAT domain-containing protein